ncbi:MAG: multiheme c-type cytochrome [Tepidisphaerales bacterium]
MRHLSYVLVCMAMLTLAGWRASAAAHEAAPAPAAAPTTDPFADNACVECHRDLPGRSSEIVDQEWKHSVHYANKVGCEGCHGGNAAVRREQFKSADEFKKASHLERNPEFLLLQRETQFVTTARGRSISYLCGKCHMSIKEHHLGSPHGEFGQPTCLYCHGQGSHRIVPATLDIIDTRPRAEGGRCSICHRAATMESVARIKKLLSDTEEKIKASGEQYKFLEAAGYKNLELEKLHHHVSDVRTQVRQMFHSFNMRDIARLTTEVEGVTDRTTAAFQIVERLQKTQREQTKVGTAAVVFLLVFAGLLVYYKNAFHAHGPAAPASGGAEPGPGVSQATDRSHGTDTRT